MKSFFEHGAALLAGFAVAVLGWYGWVLVFWVACMILDYISGTAAALKCGEWSSKKAREGIWHKVGIIMSIFAAIIVDCVIGVVVGNLDLKLPFSYSALISPVVTVCYIFTELGSIIENAGKLGARVPGFLTKVIASLHKQVDPPEDQSETK